MTADIVYGRRPVRELVRGNREALEIWATERALSAEPWLRDARVRITVKPERELTATAGVRDHQGVVARAEPFRYADAWEIAAQPSPLIVCLDRVSDPRNLGAVARSAEGAGATGIIVPEHGSARVTAAVCKSSAGAVEHLPVAVVTNLARYLGEIKGPSLWVYAATAHAPASLWETRFTEGAAFVLGAEGRGLRPLVRRACDESVSIPLLGKVDSLNVSVAAALLVFEARRQRA
ncbi:MAG: 23S rRNA (guanosine(2251)-2'-O)-methyltransferase RlmB [Gaiellaceae bacterium]